MQDYRHILIAVNEAHGPLETGLRLAREECSWVTVVKVTPRYEGDIDLTGTRDIEAVITSDWRRQHEALRDDLYDAEVNGKVRVEAGEIAETIIDVAREEECDLIIMGSRQGAGFVSRFLGGNLVDKVTRGAPCPVMVVNTGVPARQSTTPLSREEPVPVY